MATVLLLEPHAESARVYAQNLTRAGFRVETITAEPERLDRAADLVVISVPRLERSFLRVFADGPSVPRIVLSSEEADAKRAAEFRCAAVLIRPVMYDDLVKVARQVLRNVAAEQLRLKLLRFLRMRLRSPSSQRRNHSRRPRACIFRLAIHPASRCGTPFWRRRSARSFGWIR